MLNLWPYVGALAAVAVGIILVIFTAYVVTGICSLWRTEARKARRLRKAEKTTDVFSSERITR